MVDEVKDGEKSADAQAPESDTTAPAAGEGTAADTPTE